MKKLIYLLLAMPLLFSSCSKEEKMVNEEAVQVSFSAELPKTIDTRAGNEASVNKVVCAVFENGAEISALRETVAIQTGQPIVYAPRLIKGRTYDIVFWAMKDESYNVENLTNIVRESNVVEEDCDAFTACTEITVSGSDSKEVTLSRPFAQLNIGVTNADWDAVVKLGQTPKTTIINTTGKAAFNALTGKPTGSDVSISYTLGVFASDLKVNNVIYKSIAMCYMLPEEGKENFEIQYTVKDETDKSIRENVPITSVPMEKNHKTNIVGGLLTGMVTYSITISDAFEEKEHNKEI